MRNRLLFENNRDHIVQEIKVAIMDMHLWREALIHNEPAMPSASSPQPQLITDILPQETCFYCVADASWKSPTEKAGIGWSLHSRQGTPIIQGSSAIAPTYSVLEAEAMAILLAVQQLHRLSYKNVMILGENSQLFKSLEGYNQRNNRGMACNEASILVQDILKLSKLNNFTFMKVPRMFVQQVDQLAKRARYLEDKQYVISWLNN